MLCQSECGLEKSFQTQSITEGSEFIKNNSTAYMYNNFFIHSCVGGHLGGFHVLAIVNSVAMNVGTCVFFSYDFLRV